MLSYGLILKSAHLFQLQLNQKQYLLQYFAGFNDPKKANTLIFTPILDNKRLPENIRNFFRFGVPEVKLSPENKEDLMEKPTNGQHAN